MMRSPSRREFLAFSLGGVSYSLLFGPAPRGAAAAEAPPAGKRNVLFIAVDDLRPQLGCYGVKNIKTPNLDKLAAGGIVFNRAYCQQAVCSPSRTSLLTGRRPDTTRIYDLQTHFRKTIPDVVTLPQHFKAHGYHCQAFSKIYHGGLDDPASWSVPHKDPGKPGYGKPETLADLQKQREKLKAEEKGPAVKVLERDAKTGLVLRVTPPRFRVRGPSWEDPDVADNALADGATADMAVEALRQIKDKPFFLAVGFLKPHLPFVAPKKYFDLYPPGSVSLADNPFPPKDCPPLALTDWGELRAYSDIPKQGKLSDEKALELVRAYHAATSYTDAQIGRLLDELANLGLAESTVVAVWGDHGWHLGEHGHWCKHTNFEIATRSPLLFRAPGKKAGAKTDALAEFVDIFPTLCELCGLPLPDGLEGTSLAPLFDEPGRPWKKAALSQYPRGKAMGYSLRTDRYRYTEWKERAGGNVVARELYDHQTDPAENLNLAEKAEHKELVAQLGKLLNDGWRAALPPAR